MCDMRMLQRRQCEYSTYGQKATETKNKGWIYGVNKLIKKLHLEENERTEMTSFIIKKCNETVSTA